MGAWSEELDAIHRSETVSLVKQLPLDRQDIIFLSEYQSSTKTEPNDEFLRIRRQTTALKKALMRESERRVQVAPYDINQFLY